MKACISPYLCSELYSLKNTDYNDEQRYEYFARRKYDESPNKVGDTYCHRNADYGNIQCGRYFWVARLGTLPVAAVSVVFLYRCYFLG